MDALKTKRGAVKRSPTRFETLVNSKDVDIPALNVFWSLIHRLLSNLEKFKFKLKSHAPIKMNSKPKKRIVMPLKVNMMKISGRLVILLLDQNDQLVR